LKALTKDTQRSRLMSEATATHLSVTELGEQHSLMEPSPRDNGTVEMVVVRPENGIRETPDSVELSEKGLADDHWSKGEYADNRDVQVTIMNSRVLNVIAGRKERWALAGDNLVVDLDVTKANLSPGQQLRIGSVLLEISETPHKGCPKFSKRFGADALRWVNLGDGPDLRLRGIYARVVEQGTISVGDRISKV
jgi:MOSC domain-containing protein YiiM